MNSTNEEDYINNMNNNISLIFNSYLEDDEEILKLVMETSLEEYKISNCINIPKVFKIQTMYLKLNKLDFYNLLNKHITNFEIFILESIFESLKETGCLNKDMQEIFKLCKYQGHINLYIYLNNLLEIKQERLSDYSDLSIEDGSEFSEVGSEFTDFGDCDSIISNTNKSEDNSDIFKEKEEFNYDDLSSIDELDNEQNLDLINFNLNRANLNGYPEKLRKINYKKLYNYVKIDNKIYKKPRHTERFKYFVQTYLVKKEIDINYWYLLASPFLNSIIKILKIWNFNYTGDYLRIIYSYLH